ncbi:MAG: FtsX-like permease family protein, partial [Acidobacteriaceae bacterium]|nr:FtsX-like permease family protein [Acidobacteriaceae bacterium]
MSVIVRTAGDPRGAVAVVEGQLYAVDRKQPVFDVKTMQERQDQAMAPQRFELFLIGTFAVIAVVLAAFGIYGVMSYLVARRRREIGIRLALGAAPRNVLRLMMRETVVLACVAVLAGLAGAWALTRFLGSMLYGVTAKDPVTFAATPVLLVAIALAGSLWPARQAAMTEPSIALREE